MLTVTLQLLDTPHSDDVKLRKNYTMLGKIERLHPAHMSGRGYAFWPSPVNLRHAPLFLDAHEFAIDWKLTGIVLRYQDMINERVMVGEADDGRWWHSVFGRTSYGYPSAQDAINSGEMSAACTADDFLREALKQAGIPQERIAELTRLIAFGWQLGLQGA